MFPHTAAAWKRLKFNFRAMICELLYSWAFRAKPDGYIPAIWVHLMTRKPPDQKTLGRQFEEIWDRNASKHYER